MGKVVLNLLIILNFLSGADIYETVFDGNCGFCHNLKDNSSGPFLNVIIKRYRAKYPKKEDFTKAIERWIDKPSYKTSLFPEAIKRYGLMPKVDIDEESIKGIADYLSK